MRKQDIIAIENRLRDGIVDPLDVHQMQQAWPSSARTLGALWDARADALEDLAEAEDMLKQSDSESHDKLHALQDAALDGVTILGRSYDTEKGMADAMLEVQTLLKEALNA